MALALVATACLGTTARAAVLVFETPATVSGNTDVVNTGTKVFANNLGGVATTINGVVFTAGQTGSGTTRTMADGMSTIVSPTGSFSTASVFSSAAAPFSTLSTVYADALRSAMFESGNGQDVWTVNLNGLTVGHTYKVQLWANDSRGGTRTQTITGGNAVVLTMSTPATSGGVGQYTVGTFTADATTQSFTIKGSINTQLNAIQLRDYGVIPEPATLALSVMGLGVLAWQRSRRKRTGLSATRRCQG